jgi:DNA replication protein DnaC
LKRLWQLGESELLAGSLTLARCDRCGGSGVSRRTLLVYDDDDLRETEQEATCDCREFPAELLARANLPDGRFDGLTLADLDWNAVEPPEVTRTVQDYAEHLEEWLAEGVGLTLYGAVGTGKTHIAVGLVKLACGLGIEARFLTMAELLGAIKATYDRNRTVPHRRSESDALSEAGLLDKLAELPLLALDDLGTENPTSWARDRLYTLVNRRWLAERPIIVTTNYGPETLVERLGERTVSRLWGTSLRVRLQGSDYRERTRRNKIRRMRARAANLQVVNHGP